MKFRMNGKELKKNIESVLLKGKWNSGLNSKNMSLPSNIVISIGDESYLYNGDNYTYVQQKINLDNEYNNESGRVAIDSDILLKYLKDDETTIGLDDNILKVNVNGMTAKIPILERHESNDAILRTSENYEINRDMDKGIAITPKTKLNTRIKVSTKELQEAMKSCEAVGNSIFQLDFDGEILKVSSSKDTEEVIVEIEVIESVGQEATMDVSAPFYKHLESVTTILSYNDDAPLSVISGGLAMLRAPRIQN
jgi:hypothetical protein